MQSGEATPPFDEPDGHQTGQGMVSLPSDQGEGKRKTVHQTALTGTSFGLEGEQSGGGTAKCMLWCD